MVHFENRHTKQLLTENHSVYLKHRTNSRYDYSNYEPILANKVKKSWHKVFPLAATLQEGQEAINSYLIGWWLTDAWVHGDGKACMFSQSKTKTLNKLREALKAVDCSFSEYIKEGKKENHQDEHTFYVTGSLAEYLLAKYPDRKLNWGMLQWDYDSRLQLLEGLLDGDGTRNENQHSETFWSQKKERLDIVSAICTTLNIRNYIDYQKGCVYLNRKHNSTEFQSKHTVETVTYGGSRVWCLPTETGAFVVRRKGRPFISGNSGFPKSLNISKALDRKAGKLGVEGSSFTVAGYSHNPNKIQHTAPSKGYSPPAPTTPEAELWEGYGTALKPAWEPIVLAQKPREGTFANNVLKYGVGGLNIDGCRVPAKNPRKVKTGRSNPNGGKVNSTDYGEYAEWDGEYKEENKGRWPANFIHDGSDEVVELFPYTESPSGMNYRNASENRAMSGPNTERSLSPNGHNDSGSAARFFYCAKVNKKERNAGCENMKEKVTSHDGRETEIENPYQRNKSSYNNNNNHPTVKPLSLLKYLANLILPPKREEPTRTLFVPYSGSGSEMIGGLQAGWDKVIGIEKDEGYSEIAEARLEYWIQQLYEETTVKEGETLKLFD
jgi:site-specific DNA-methyltransferase (adenine-specific)